MTTPTVTSARVLVVDDAEHNRYVLSMWLRSAGYDVLEAKTGAAALAVAAAHPIDIVVLDVNLPDMSGYDVCERIKADERNAAIPVLQVSATAIESADRSEGLRRGADGYLVEPVEREELVASVQALLRGAAAQRTALRLAWQLRRLNEATLAVNDARTLEQLITTIAREASALFGTEATVVVLVNNEELRATASPGRPATSGAFLSADLNTVGGHSGVLQIRVPSIEPIRFLSDETAIVLTQFARAANIAIKNVRTYDIERRIALTLQQSLLPLSVPAILGIDVAVRYEASTEHAEVGGDFYELFTLDDDRVAIAIGDIAGHSLEAAAVMAQLRTGIRSYMLEGHGPGATLARLNRLLLRFHRDVTATLCCGIFERRSGRCELANAGHPPALVIAHDGSASFLPFGGPLLGVDAPGVTPYTFTLAPVEVLVLFTDGLIERRDETIDESLARLAGVVPGPVESLEALCDRLLREAGPARVDDDIALVAIRRAVG